MPWPTRPSRTRRRRPPASRPSRTAAAAATGRAARSTPCAGIDDPAPQQQLRHPMPRPHQILPRGLTSPDQITRGFLRQTGYPHRHDLVQPQQPGQMQRVPRVGLHPIPGRTEQLRRRRHLTPPPRRRHGTGQAEPGRPGLVHHRTRTRQPADPLQHLRVRRRQPRLEHLPGLPIDRRRDDRPRVHIQPNTRTLGKHRDLLTPVGKAKHGNALGNPRECVSEVPASNYSTRRAVTTYGLSQVARLRSGEAVAGPSR